MPIELYCKHVYKNHNWIRHRCIGTILVEMDQLLQSAHRTPTAFHAPDRFGEGEEDEVNVSRRLGWFRNSEKSPNSEKFTIPVSPQTGYNPSAISKWMSPNYYVHVLWLSSSKE